MSAKQHQYPYSGHPKDQTRPDQNCIRISFQPDWQIDNGFFNKPIMVCTQIVRCRVEGTQNKDFSTVSQMDLTRFQFRL